MKEKTATPPVITYSTANLDVAAYLLAGGFSILSAEPADGPKVSFTFADPKGRAEEACLNFYRGASVSARAFADAQRQIRDLMWEAKRREKGRP